MPRDNNNEIFVVVDKSDNVIEYKTREECHNNKSLIHRSVYVVLQNKDDEIITQIRSREKDTYPGFMTVSASGHVSIRETYKEAAQREMKEELGIFARIFLKKKMIFNLPNETEMVGIFTGRYDAMDFNIDSSELTSVQCHSINYIKKNQDKLTPGAVMTLKALKIL